MLEKGINVKFSRNKGIRELQMSLRNKAGGGVGKGWTLAQVPCPDNSQGPPGRRTCPSLFSIAERKLLEQSLVRNRNSVFAERLDTG